MTDPTSLTAMAARLEVLRSSGDRETWAKLRRLAITTRCCSEAAPLIEVMETDPPCVFVTQPSVSDSATTKFAEGSPREAWQGVGQDRGGRGIEWLRTYEQMAGTNIRHWVWCRHRRWYVAATPAPRAVAGSAGWIPLEDVLTKRGQRIVS